MTSSEITRIGFTLDEINLWAPSSARNTNWPIVYVIDDDLAARAAGSRPVRRVYVGESLNAAGRMRQHLATSKKDLLDTARVILDERFNKSACLDLESFLIRLLSGDGAFEVLNRNDGIRDADYYDRAWYQSRFREIFEQLRSDGLFSRPLTEILNSDLYKLSPFKSLTEDQAAAVEDIMDGLFEDLDTGGADPILIEGRPGTGKTVVAIFLLKLIADIAATTDVPEDIEADTPFAEYFLEGYPALLRGRHIALVVPQQSLRESIKRVFRRTPGLSPEMVLTPFEVGQSDRHFDLLIVDEAHRLNRRANQPSGVQNAKFASITTALFGSDDLSKTQLDWIRAKSDHQVFLVDSAQAVRPADLPEADLAELERIAAARHRVYRLATQMRVRAGDDYVRYVRAIIGAEPTVLIDRPDIRDFGEYEFGLFDDLGEMRAAIADRERSHGLARLLAGYAWPWRSRSDPDAFDIVIGSESLRWNSTQKDWIASPRSRDEVGSIHTVQGYDLNYAGVIIGPDLRFDPKARRIVFDRDAYFDMKGKENNPQLGITFGDEDLLRYVQNIYAVLMTRGIRGTFVYAVDPDLRAYLARLIPAARASSDEGTC